MCRPESSLLTPPRSARSVPISAERCANILSTLQQMNTATPDMEGCRQLLECVADELHAERGVLILRNPLTMKLEFVVHNQDPAIPKLYADYYCDLDPTGLPDAIRGTAPLPAGPRFHAVSDLKDVIDYGWLVSTEFYNDFFRSADIYYDLVAFVSTPSARAAVGLHRAHGLAPFSAEEAAILDMIAPFVGNHLERMASASILSTFQKGADKGVILCDVQGRILYCNDIARTLCSSLAQADSTPDLLPDSSYIGYRLDDLEALAARCDLEVVCRDVMLDEGRPGRMITLEGRSGAAAFTELLQQRFGLTEREIEVLSRVMTGSGNRDIAQALFIAECTVKKHMQSISTKVGARTRTAITHVVRQELGLTL
jgi:DNA-binding CsgD family transcriptional regulator